MVILVRRSNPEKPPRSIQPFHIHPARFIQFYKTDPNLVDQSEFSWINLALQCFYKKWPETYRIDTIGPNFYFFKPNSIFLHFGECGILPTQPKIL